MAKTGALVLPLWQWRSEPAGKSCQIGSTTFAKASNLRVMRAVDTLHIAGYIQHPNGRYKGNIESR